MLDRLAELFVDRGVPEYVRSNSGSEFTAAAVRDWLKGVGVKMLYIEPGSPWENGYVESFKKGGKSCGANKTAWFPPVKPSAAWTAR